MRRCQGWKTTIRCNSKMDTRATASVGRHCVRASDVASVMAKDSSTRARPVHRYQLLIQTRLTQLTTAEQAVAAHLALHPEQVPFETAASLAKRLGMSAMTVGRTLKALGYKGLSELRFEMRSEVSDVSAAPWVCLGAAASTFRSKNLDRARAMRAEVEAIEAVYALSETASWRKAVEAIAAADQIFVMGFQPERGFALAFADQLASVRPQVRYLPLENRAFADLHNEAAGKSCLVVIDTRRDSQRFRVLSPKMVELGIPLVIAAAVHCSWAAQLTPYALQVLTDSGRFSDNDAHIFSMLNLLLEDVTERLGVAVNSQR
jgi:DNA-binding MurR/RpiR family transcriptional regulator